MENRDILEISRGLQGFQETHVAEADNPRPINQRPQTVASSSPAVDPGPAVPPGSFPQPQSHGPAHGTSTVSDHNIFGHCIIADANNSYHNWDAGL